MVVVKRTKSLIRAVTLAQEVMNTANTELSGVEWILLWLREGPVTSTTFLMKRYNVL
jgi:hypothetical protein